jgi:calcineurin-like phosphoesterase family protein
MSFGRGARPARWWLTQLNGNKIYIKGSHDQGIRPTSVLDRVLFVSDAVIVKYGNNLIYVCHEPDSIPRNWKGWAIHGHVHNNRPFLDLKHKHVNVSADVMSYRPRTLFYLGMLMEMIEE